MYVVDKQNTPAQALSLVESILNKMETLSKPQFKFMSWIFMAWLGLPVRHTFSNLARFGPYCDKTIRLHFAKAFCFAQFCQLLIQNHTGAERICAFDPSYLPKSGKSTYGVDYWWCGTLQQALRGLEVGILGVVDVKARTAFPLQATQTPSRQELKAQGKSLMEHYISLLQAQKQRLQQLGIKYVTADAYFPKQTYVDAVLELQMHLITRLRHGRP